MRASQGGDGILWAEEVVKWAGCCTIRVIARGPDSRLEAMQGVIDCFSPFGVTAEGHQEFGLVALEIPPEADIAAAKAELRRGELEGSWAYEEDVSRRSGERYDGWFARRG